MDLFRREALIRMLEILIASIISLFPPLIPPPISPSASLFIHPFVQPKRGVGGGRRQESGKERKSKEVKDGWCN